MAILYINFGKKAFYWLIAIAILIAITDQISSSFLKNYFQIMRPCNDSYLDPVAKLPVNRCPTSYSFPSSHAVNHFAVAAFCVATLHKHISWIRWLLLWAASICYAQVYVGVHFPIDVISGAILGGFLGNIAGNIFTHNFEMIPLNNSNKQ